MPEVDPKQRTRSSQGDCLQNGRGIGPDEEFVVVAQYNERYLGLLSILLVPDTPIGSEDGVECRGFRRLEQRTIVQACPALVSRGPDVMAREHESEFVREIFIEEDAHESR